jgi:hypothetical protein
MEHREIHHKDTKTQSNDIPGQHRLHLLNLSDLCVFVVNLPTAVGTQKPLPVWQGPTRPQVDA